jgi:hypothetical protein
MIVGSHRAIESQERANRRRGRENKVVHCEHHVVSELAEVADEDEADRPRGHDDIATPSSKKSETSSGELTKVVEAMQKSSCTRTMSWSG